jgi:hypothetical protein
MTIELSNLLATDRVFFERRPDRTVRIRRAFPGEIEHLAHGAGAPVPVLAEGLVHFMIVQSLPGIGIRIRLPIGGPQDAEVDLFTEAECRALLNQRNAALGDPLDPHS